MIKIFNRKLNTEIAIDENADGIQFNPGNYPEKPFVTLEFNNFSFPHHAIDCPDCNSFMKSFGTGSLDWHISFLGKTYRLDTSAMGSGDYPFNEVKVMMSASNPGTRMTLVFHELPADKKELARILKKAVDVEDYEKACVIRDLISKHT